MYKLTVLTAAAACAAVCLQGAETSQSFSFQPKGVLAMTPALAAATLTPRTAEALIDSTLGITLRQSNDFYCLIHILRWKDNSTEIEKQNWYVYHNGKAWSETQFAAGRVFGSHNVALLFLHVNARGADQSLVTPPLLSAVEIAKLKALPDGVELSTTKAGFDLKGANDENLTTLAKYVVRSDQYRVQYTADVSAKLPSMVSDLAGLLFPAAMASAKGIKIDPVVIWGGGEMYVEPIPSDIKVSGLRLVEPPLGGKADPIELGKKTFDNEGRYYWDLSAGIPLKGIKQLSFDGASQSLAPKEISRQSLIGFLNIFPMKLDTKADRQGIVPVILVGMGISDKALDRIVFAGGVGINKAQFFVGTAYSNKSFVGSTPGSVVTNRRTNLIFGVNLPLRQAVQLLKKSK